MASVGNVADALAVVKSPCSAPTALAFKLATCVTDAMATVSSLQSAPRALGVDAIAVMGGKYVRGVRWKQGYTQRCYTVGYSNYALIYTNNNHDHVRAETHDETYLSSNS